MKKLFTELLEGKEDYNSLRKYEFKLPSDLSKCYYVDEVKLTLFSNGVCALYYDKSNMDHNSNDHRVGTFVEDTSGIKIKTYSLWRDENLLEDEFEKKSDGTLFYNDPRYGEKLVEVKEKVLTLDTGDF